MSEKQTVSGYKYAAGSLAPPAAASRLGTSAPARLADPFVLSPKSQNAPTPSFRPKLLRTRSRSTDANSTPTPKFIDAKANANANDTENQSQTTIPSPTRRQSFTAYTLSSFSSLGPSRPFSPRMMSTMNMASRLAGPRVKDQTIHHSFSDRSSTHAKPAPAQDSKGSRSGGYSADGLKRVSNGLRGEWSEGRVAPCAWEPLAIPIIRLDEPKQGWSAAQAFFREGLGDKLDVYPRDVRIQEPNDEFRHEYELMRTAAEKAGKSDTNDATIAHCESIAQAAASAKVEGKLLALVRIWSDFDEETETWIRSEIAALAEEWKDRQDYPEKYEQLKMERKAALKTQMATERKAENARKKLELKEVKRKMQEEREREKREGKGKKGFGIGQDDIWPLELKDLQINESESDESSSSDDTESDDEEGGLSSMEKKKRRKDARKAALMQAGGGGSRDKAKMIEGGVVKGEEAEGSSTVVDTPPEA